MASRTICFVNADNYPVLNPAFGEHYIGGESVQQTLLAKAFRDKGYDVSTVVRDYGQPQGETIDGIRVWKTFDPRAGLPILRFAYPRLTSIVRALRVADADIYYQSCAGMITGVVAWFCRRHGRKFVFRLAHDSDCVPGEQLIDYWRDRKIYEFGIRNADLVVAQGVRQVELMRDNYGIDSVPLNMTVEMPETAFRGERDIDILWVNNFRPFKRPELVLPLARALPDYRISMIGGPVPGNEDLFAAVEEGARDCPNLTIHGAVPYHEVNAYFDRARVFANTSDWEGFPNSFLQAWAREVPVVSFFDPDGLIASRTLGAVPGDIDEMAAVLRELLSADTERAEIGRKARTFIVENYSAAAVADQYESLIDGLSEPRRRHA